MDVGKVVLAYSGGLDTTASIIWLREKYGAEVITVTVDVGQEEDFAEVERRAYRAGASRHYTVDARREFVDRFVVPAIIMNGFYEGKYPLGTALARPLIVEKMVEVARREGATAIAHGSTSKGNDQVRFDVTLGALADDIRLVAPVREWRLTRAESVELLRAHGLEVPEKRGQYSIDSNLWSRSIEGGALDDPWAEPPEEVFRWTVSPTVAPDTPEYVEVGFESGVPTSINGERMDPMTAIHVLNGVGGRHGVGRLDHIENRLVGFKSREVYEAPAAVILYEAHRDLEKAVLTPYELRFKWFQLDPTWADLVYRGLWVEPLREVLQSAGHALNRYVTGTVRVRLYRGSVTVVGRASEYSPYSRDVADYDKGWYLSAEEARGFITVHSLHSVMALKKRRPGHGPV